MSERNRFLESSLIVDWKHPAVISLARKLAEDLRTPEQIAERCFVWVRDEIKHSRDFALTPVPCSASEVIECGSGYCYAKSHLLAALLRANRIPAGFCYQRLSRDENGPPYCLHGLNAVLLSGYGWYRMDPRGNRPGIHAQFSPPHEKLAFEIRLPGERNLFEVLPEPLPVVVQTLRSYRDANLLWQDLPDLPDSEADGQRASGFAEGSAGASQL